MQRHVCIALAAVLAASLAGCALKPPPASGDLREQALPNLRTPAQWTTPVAGGAVATQWLAEFHDAALDALVAEALTYNADLRVSAARVARAEAQSQAANAGLWPVADFLGHGGSKTGGDGSGIRGVWLNASWELDLWGRVRYGAAAGASGHAAAQADYDYARQSLAALVARSWFIAIEARQQRDLAASALADGGKLLSLAGDRERVGRGDGYDVATASANVETYRDVLRQADLAYAQALRALETLLGRYPAAAISAPATLPALPAMAAAGVPSELLERRPDVVAAERRVDAAFDRVEEAKAAMLPRLSLTAGGSRISSDIFVLQNGSDTVWGIGANLVAPLFHGGELQANVRIRTAEQQQAIAEFARIAQNAFGEVENALANEAALRDREPILMRAASEGARAVDLSQVRVRVGSGDQRAVLQQQLGVYGTRSALLRVQGEQRVQRVNLHLALGGGFEPPAPLPSTPVASASKP